MPGGSDVPFVVVDAELDELCNKIQPELVGVGFRIALFHGQYGIEEESALPFNARAPIVSSFLAARIKRTDGVFKLPGKSPSRSR